MGVLLYTHITESEPGIRPTAADAGRVHRHKPLFTLAPQSRVQPGIPPFSHKIVVVQMWIGLVDPVNFFPLARAECFAGIQAPNTFEQTLPSQNFMQTRDTACELIGHVKERRVAIGHFHISF
jgi:hypothetical protein